MHDRIFWGLAAISAVIVSWLLYRYLLPTTWREWTRAGLLQAFIIAFYAEMYGFPLTIYVLTRLFKLDVQGTSLWDGNLWTYVTGSPQVMLISMIIGYTIAVFGILLLAASWRELYRATKERRLATGGPYAFVRHPQYTGLFLAVFGEGVVHWPTVFSLAAFAVIVFAYAMLARKEEQEMLRKFGREYLQYKRSRPMFFPHRQDWSELARRVSRPTER